MAYQNNQPQYVTAQPHGQGVILADPFKHFQNAWSVGLCDCCDDMSQCCYAYFCWYCFVGSLAGKIDESCISCFCVPNALAIYRMKIRSVFKIEGSSCSDWCTVCWCPFCAGLQMSNELRNRGLAR